MMLFLSSILSFIVIRGLRFEFGAKVLTLRNTESFLWLLLFLFFTWFFSDNIRNSDKRLKKYAAVFGIVIAFYHVVGSSLERMTGISWIFESVKMLSNFLNMFFSFFCIYYCAAFLSFSLLEKISDKVPIPVFRRMRMKTVLIVWILLLISYIPWYLYFYPGIMTYDSGAQVYDALTTETLSDHNPAFVTLLIRAVMIPVVSIIGSNLTGVGVCTFLQMLIMTLIFALSFVKICAYVRHGFLRALFFLWFAFYPVNNIYSITMWKDILFSGCLLFFMLLLDDCVENEDFFFTSRKHCILLSAVMLLLPLLRHNGIAISAGMSIAFLLRFKKYRRQAAMICFGALLAFGVWKLVMLPALDAQKSPSAELLNIPIQQIARVLSNHHGEISPRLLDDLSAYFSEPEFWTEYWEKIADPVKVLFNQSLYNSDPGKFFSLWLELGKLYPMEYLEAFLQNNYGYWYPETTWWITGRGVILNIAIEGLYQAPILRLGIIDKTYNWFINGEYLKTPILPLLFKPGAIWWLWICCGLFCLFRNRRKFVLFLPGLFLWLTLQLSAVYCEFRYAYGLFVCLPLLLAASLHPDRQRVMGDEPDKNRIP